jgi:spermidine synthase
MLMLIHCLIARFGRTALRGVVLFVGAAIALSACRVMPAGETLVHQERSAWQTIVVVDHNLRRCLRFGAGPGGLNQSCMSLDQPQRLHFEYTRAMVAATMLWQPQPRRLLVIGLGGGSIPMALATLLPDAHIDAVEIDPAVIRTAEHYFGFRPGPRLRAYAQDGRDFVSAARARGDRYDAVLLDAFDQDGIPPALFTVAFLDDIRQVLADEGAFLANTFGGTPTHAAELAVTGQVFGRFHAVRFGLSEMGGNRLLVAARGDLPAPATFTDSGAYAADLERVGIRSDWLRSWRFAEPRSSAVAR